MGCLNSINQISVEHVFNSNDILYLTQSWNIIKGHNFQKFAQNVLSRTMKQSSSFRQFWLSKIEVEGNNYDFGQHDSCLRSDLNWLIGLPDHGVQLISIGDKFLSTINDENQLQTQIETLDITENNFLIEYESLVIMKQCILEVLRERFQSMNIGFTEDQERICDKFLEFIIKYLPKKTNGIQESVETVVSPISNQK